MLCTLTSGLGGVMDYQFINTVKVLWSHDLQDFATSILSNNFKRALIITGRGNTATIAKDVCGSLVNCTCNVIYGVPQNAPLIWIRANINAAKEFAPDVVITVGGGSVHDTGKLMAILLHKDNKIALDCLLSSGSLQFIDLNKGIPVVTVPTLPGTGAEVSPAAVLTVGNTKQVYYSPMMHPLLAFINTDFFRSLSKRQLAISTFDSLIQSVEGMISNQSNQLSLSFSRESIRLYCAAASQLACYDRRSLTNTCLEYFALSAIFSSYVCSTASVGAIHAISNPISARYGLQHGVSLALVASDVLSINLRDVDKNKVSDLDKCITLDIRKGPQPIRNICRKIESIISQLCILEDVSVDFSEQANLIVEESFNPDMFGNPHSFTHEEIRKVIMRQ